MQRTQLEKKHVYLVVRKQKGLFSILISYYKALGIKGVAPMRHCPLGVKDN